MIKYRCRHRGAEEKVAIKMDGDTAGHSYCKLDCKNVQEHPPQSFWRASTATRERAWSCESRQPWLIRDQNADKILSSKPRARAFQSTASVTCQSDRDQSRTRTHRAEGPQKPTRKKKRTDSGELNTRRREKKVTGAAARVRARALLAVKPKESWKRKPKNGTSPFNFASPLLEFSTKTNAKMNLTSSVSKTQCT